MTGATYLYAIVKSAARPAVARAPGGLPGASRPQPVHAGSSLWLITAEVPLEQYGPTPLETALSDIDWVGRVALAHEEVVEHFTRRRGVTVIPMKLFTMFSTPEKALAVIVARRARISQVMRRIEGAEEWGVRILRGEAPVAAAAAPPRPGSGTAFLEARKQARDDRRSARQQTSAAAAEVFAQLARIARDAVRREEAPPSGVTPPLLDAAFLVPHRDRARFNRVAREQAIACAQSGAQLTLTGPWPPYNFVRLDEGAS